MFFNIKTFYLKIKNNFLFHFLTKFSLFVQFLSKKQKKDVTVLITSFSIKNITKKLKEILRF
jgi:hypothetical protein